MALKYDGLVYFQKFLFTEAVVEQVPEDLDPRAELKANIFYLRRHVRLTGEIHPKNLHGGL